MRAWIKYLLGIVALVLIAAYGEFVMDFRGARSQLNSHNAFAAITLTDYGDRDAKIKELRAKYGDRARADDDVPAGASNGKWTITLDGSVLEEGRIVVKLAGMYGLFAVASDDTTEGIFSFSIVPGRADLSPRRLSKYCGIGLRIFRRDFLHLQIPIWRSILAQPLRRRN